MSLHALATHMAQTGRGPDSMLVHMSPREVQSLQALAKANGGELTINPHTGLPEAGFLEKLLPMLAGGALTALSGGALSPMMAAMMVGGGTALATGSLNKGLMAGMGAFGGGGLGEGLMAAGAAGAAPTVAAPIATGASELAGSSAALQQNALTGLGLPSGPPIPTGASFAPSTSPDIMRAVTSNTVGPTAGVVGPVSVPGITPSTVQPPVGGLEQLGQGFKNLGTKQGLTDFMGTAATKTSEATGVGGIGGLLKSGMAAAVPMMADSSKLADKPAEGNIREFDFDAITGKYTKRRVIPASQYDSSTMMAAKGGLTSLLSFAEGGAVSAEEAASIRATIQAGPQTNAALDQAFLTYTPAQLSAAFPEFGDEEAYRRAAAKSKEDAAADSSRETASSAGGSSGFDPNDPKALRNLIQKGPQTNDALDAAMLKYTPAQLQAAFPEFGRVSDYNSAAQAAYARQEAKDTEGRRTNPNYVSTAVGGPIVSKVPQSEIDAGKAAAQQAVKEGKLSQEDYDFLVWRQNETSGMSQQKISEDYARQGRNPYDPESWKIAKEANANAKSRNDLLAQNGQPVQKPDWTVPGYAARQTQRDKDEAARQAVIAAGQSPNVVIGPFGAGPTGGPTGGTTGGGTADNTRARALSMDRASSTAPTTSKAQLQSYYNTYFSDMEHVPVGSSQAWANGTITKTSPTTATYTPTGGKPVTLTQGMDVNTIIQQNPNIAAQWQTEYGYTYTPQTQPGRTTTSGPRVGTVTGTSTPASKAAMQGYYDQYFTEGVPIGYSQPWGGGTIVKQSADTAYYTEKNGTKHVLQKGMDVDSVYALSPYIAEQWGNEFLYTIDPTKAPPIAGPATTTTLTPFSAPSNLTSPYSFSKQGAMTPQGVMGGSEKGGTIANASQIVPAYQQYWQNAPVGSTVDFAGGKLSRTGGAQAVYTGADGKTYSLSPTSDLNIIAAQNPAIAETWRNEFGMVPQNYMTGESARNYEFLRGNEPYSVNQQTRGIARPYGEMALGLPGATFGNDAIINQRDINDANAAIAKETANGGKATTVAPAIQRGYGVTDPGTYNMQTVYDPGTQRYVENNLYTTPEQTKADAAKAAATPGSSNQAAVVDPNAPSVTGDRKNGGLLALGGMTGISSLGDYSDGGRLLRGPGDGVSDSIPATIGNKQQARLADGEFVVPARIVSELGNGSTEAGARQLYAMMDRIQKNRSKTIGKNNVAVNSKAAKQLPA